MRGQTRSPIAILPFVLTFWALAMVVPDIYRLVEPLASFGFYANNDGLVTDVRGPFHTDAESPAFQAGMRPGDRLDLTRMQCIPFDSAVCSSAIAALGGMRLVARGQLAVLYFTTNTDQRARQLQIAAQPRPYDWSVLVVLLLDQLAAILVIGTAAFLVLSRPGPMTWGFFLYVIWFNPGQSAQYYAMLLYYSPAALLSQNIAGAVAQGAGSAGFIAFACRAPTGVLSPRWRSIEQSLPILAALIALLLASSYANLLGYGTEVVTRLGVLSGLIVAASAFVILLLRQRELPPQDFQRLRWVIWGCLIGLPALVLADAATTTTLLNFFWKGYAPPEQIWGLLYLINGVLCLLVSEAIRRPYVVTVSIPLRRVTILGLILSLPILFLHREVDHLRETLSESVTLPAWVWVTIAAATVFVLSKIHDHAVHHVDRLFNRAVVKAEDRIGDAVLKATSFATIEALLVEGVREALGLASAGVFRQEDRVFRRTTSDQSWDESAIRKLEQNDGLLERVREHRPFPINTKAASINYLPTGLNRPILAVPIGDRLRCVALALYGPHLTGHDLSHEERNMLANLADRAANSYMKLSEEALRQRVAALESQLNSITTATSRS
jgi:hypothetical protein